MADHYHICPPSLTTLKSGGLIWSWEGKMIKYTAEMLVPTKSEQKQKDRQKR